MSSPIKQFFDSLAGRRPRSPDDDLVDVITILQMYVGALRGGEMGYELVAKGLEDAIVMLEDMRTGTRGKP